MDNTRLAVILLKVVRNIQMINVIDGIAFGQMLKAGLLSLKANKQEVNDLNVFPIPDGDTGENMYATMLGGIRAILDTNEDVLGKVAKQVGEGMLLGARGNSGVILSQFFTGIVKVFSEHEKADVQILSDAFKKGVQFAYASVAEPVEGTMLTVLREASEYASLNLNKNSTIITYMTDYLEESKRSVKATPEKLFVLKEAGVVDSGGVGIVHIIDGFLKFLKGEKVSDVPVGIDTDNKQVNLSLFNENSVMEFGYCTEFLLQLTKSKTDIQNFNLDDMKKRLSEFGDSLVAVLNGSIVKIHVHTLNPGGVLSYAQSFGEFLTLKIENMTLQHNEANYKKEEISFKKNLNRKRMGLVTVANGDGFISTFKDLGSDVVIDGGQGNNPSVEVFLKAYDAVNADVIFVLPNNGNIMMAAKESAKLYKESEIKVVDSKTLGDGYSALGAIDLENGTPEEIFEQMENDLKSSVCLMVSKANRETKSGSVEIKDGDYIGFTGKDIMVAEQNKIDCAIRTMTKNYAEEKEFIVAFYGKDVTETEKEEFSQKVNENFPMSEFYALDGGQEIYDIIVVLQ